MTDRERIEETEEVSAEGGSSEGRRRRVKVTDKRRVSANPEEGPAAEEAPEKARPPRPEDAVPGEGVRGGASQEAPEADQVGSEVERARAEAEEYLDHLRRLKAEFDNYRKRVLKEQTRAVELATEPLMTKLLEVLDEFELALIAAERKPEFERFLRGVEMVYAKLNDILRSEGLERIEAEGKPFDPELHEALLQSEGDGEGEARVADVLRPGYRLKGRVIRPAGVKVSRG